MDQKATALLILQRIRRRQQQLRALLDQERLRTEKAVRKWRHLNRVSTSLRSPNQNRPKVIRQRPGPLIQPSFDLYRYTGLLATEFFRIFREIIDDLGRCRTGSGRRSLGSNSLIDQGRLILVLSYLRRGQQRVDLAQEWEVSTGYITREVHFLIPILAARCNFIKPPTIWAKHPFEDVVGAIDCTAHRRCRVHPHQHDYYRGDKKCFFITAQVVCGLDGQLFHIAFFPGRVNDQAAFLQTWRERLAIADIKLLADGGYSDDHLITPQNAHGQQWNNTQKSLRSIVEHVNSVVQCFHYAAKKVRGNEPELQTYCLKVIYNLTALILNGGSLRDPLFLAP